MGKQSWQSALASKILPTLSAKVFPSSWVDAGDDRARLGEIAQQRRRLDGPRPDLILQRRWGRATTQVQGSDLHLFTPKGGSTGRVLFYCHGGAFVIGPSSMEWLFAARVARKLGYDLALFDYPKVPETDSYAILATTLGAYEEILKRYEPAEVAIAGTSAGGGLAASTLLQLARAGQTVPAVSFLISPWLDMTLSHPDIETAASSDKLLPLDQLRRDGELYAATRDTRDPLVSPRFMSPAEFAQLPPTVIVAGEDELLLPEAEEFVANLSQAGVNASLIVEDHGQHAGVLGKSPEADAALAQSLAEIRRKVAN